MAAYSAPIRVLTWNLFHGRSEPGSGRDLQPEFTDALAGWAWDVALLQEVPPWWPQPLARATGADARWVLTSRNHLLPVRRTFAILLPDLLRSEGGGANAILVRGGAGPIGASGHVELTRRPERRVAHGVQVAGGRWVVNVHATLRPKEQTRADAARTLAAGREWAGGAPLIVGGDFNLKQPELDGLTRVASHWVDHVFAPGPAAGRGEVLDAGTLSDHKPLAVDLE